MRILLLAPLMLAFAATGHAQPATPSPPAPAGAEAKAPPPTVDIADAYKKEFAFLEAQKRELSQRLIATRGEFERERVRLEREVSGIENQLLAVKGEAESIATELATAERARDTAVENTEMLGATLEQAKATLTSFGDSATTADTYAALAEAAKLQVVFDAALARLPEFARVRRETGKFYLPNGNEVQGTVVYLGNVAAVGSSTEGSGALAPAGGGKFKLWNVPEAAGSGAAAQALAQGKPAPTLGIFVFENLGAAASEPQPKTFWGEMQKGGAIGYVILALGALALALAGLRALFLRNAGASVNRIMERVLPLVRQHRVADAIEACKQFKGSAARVVTAALRNIDREREHLEDIIAESILHESTHLNRFGGFITLTAGVAPLLGLLGTVTGMIQTFDVITEFGNADPKMLSGGIAIALVTTEQGLLVAIPCLLIGNLLNGWAESIKDDMEKAALKVINAYQDGHIALAKAA